MSRDCFIAYSDVEKGARTDSPIHRDEPISENNRCSGIGMALCNPGSDIVYKKKNGNHVRERCVVIKMYEENKRMQLNCCAMCRCESQDQTPDTGLIRQFAVVRFSVKKKWIAFNIVLSLLDSIPSFVALITVRCASVACGIATSYSIVVFMHIISTLITSD